MVGQGQDEYSLQGRMHTSRQPLAGWGPDHACKPACAVLLTGLACSQRPRHAVTPSAAAALRVPWTMAAGEAPWHAPCLVALIHCKDATCAPCCLAVTRITK